MDAAESLPPHIRAVIRPHAGFERLVHERGAFRCFFRGICLARDRQWKVTHVCASRVIDKGLKPEDKVIVGGLLRAIPGQKVDPQTASAAAAVK